MVHCAVGVSRSASLVLAYLMINHHLPLIEAIKTVKEHRWISPNRGFLKHLRNLDIQLRQKKGCWKDKTFTYAFLSFSFENHCAHTTSQDQYILKKMKKAMHQSKTTNKTQQNCQRVHSGSWLPPRRALPESAPKHYLLQSCCAQCDHTRGLHWSCKDGLKLFLICANARGKFNNCI